MCAHIEMLSSGRQGPVMRFSDVVRARAQLAQNKVGGGDSTIVTEMIRELPIGAVHHIARMFAQRFAGDGVHDEERETNRSWKKHFMVFLNKVPHAKKLDCDYRGISLLDVVMKWYMTVIVNIAKSIELEAGQEKGGSFLAEEKGWAPTNWLGVYK